MNGKIVEGEDVIYREQFTEIFQAYGISQEALKENRAKARDVVLAHLNKWRDSHTHAIILAIETEHYLSRLAENAPFFERITVIYEQV